MGRAALSLILGMLSTSVLVDAISVYVFHDVDQDKIGHLHEAFEDLSIEMIVFSLIVGGSVWLLSLFGRRVFKLRGYSPRPTLALSLGVSAIVIQYPFEFIGRLLGPNLADPFRAVYIIGAILLCTAALLRDSFRQMKASTNARESIDARDALHAPFRFP